MDGHWSTENKSDFFDSAVLWFFEKISDTKENSFFFMLWARESLSVWDRTIFEKNNAGNKESDASARR